MLATAATVVVILVYMLVMLGCGVYYWRADRFNPLLHGLFPLAGIVLFAFPLYYQYRPIPAAPLQSISHCYCARGSASQKRSGNCHS